MVTSFTARNPVDIAAVVPIMLGFEPAESLVLLTFGGSRPFHARMDLPSSSEIEACLDLLVEAAERHRVDQVVVVLYTADPALSRRIVRAAVRRFGACGIEVLDGLRSYAGRLHPADRARPDLPASGIAYDAAEHPFRAQAVLDGYVTLDSRERLAESIAYDREGSGEIERHLDAADAMDVSELALVLAEADDIELDDEGWASFLRSLSLPQAVPEVWEQLTRLESHNAIAFWSGVLRRCPREHAADPAAFLAYAAWEGGQGALAWCALDRCFEASPHHRLGSLIATALTRAVPPPRVA